MKTEKTALRKQENKPAYTAGKIYRILVEEILPSGVICYTIENDMGSQYRFYSDDYDFRIKWKISF